MKPTHRSACHPWLDIGFRLLVILALALGALAVPTGIAQADIRLRVRVTDCVTGNPIQGAQVTVLTAAAEAGSRRKATTNANGRAEINPVRYGDVTHTIRAAKDGYEPATTSQYMSAWSAYNVDLCLNPLTTPTSTYRPPTATPLPPTFTPRPPPTLTRRPPTPTPLPSHTPRPTYSPLDSCLLCEKYILTVAIDLLPGDSALLQLLQTGDFKNFVDWGAILTKCGPDTTCQENELLFWAIKKLVKLIIKNHPVGKAVVVVYDLLADEAGRNECARLADYAWQMFKELTVAGLNYTAVAVHSPATVRITDRSGRRAGFLEDGTIVEEIPESRVIISGESKYVFVPSPDMETVELTGTGDGPVTLDVVHSNGSVVDDMTFEAFGVTAHSKGSLALNGSESALRLDRNGDGQIQSIRPSRYEQLAVEVSAWVPVTLEATVSATPILPPPSPGGMAGLGVFVLVVLVGVGGLGLAALNTRARRGAGAGGQSANGKTTRVADFHARLQAVSGPGAGVTIAIPPQGATIGRLPDCSFVIPDPSVSRRHARVVFAGDAWYLQDTGSKLGTYLNGVRIGASRLSSGDRIRIGSTEILFMG